MLKKRTIIKMQRKKIRKDKKFEKKKKKKKGEGTLMCSYAKKV